MLCVQLNKIFLILHNAKNLKLINIYVHVDTEGCHKLISVQYTLDCAAKSVKKLYLRGEMINYL